MEAVAVYTRAVGDFKFYETRTMDSRKKEKTSSRLINYEYADGGK